ncbi:MAG: UDP-N-acetyl-alpha-D-muramoyl-L-alanyl-L-glutamate epimerase [Acidimicrobiaceae bacterium]|nr:UDP-N-acetyl-alpha-D-muramoyl-L-alanyl-L-glutamate epimerase [Acidimicrobiaceae bacterium]
MPPVRRLVGVTDRFDPASFGTFHVRPPVGREGTLTLRYAFDDAVEFAEVVEFADGGCGDERLWPLAAVLAGVSYYKAAAPLPIVVDAPLRAGERSAVELAYDHGLREFAVRNDLPVPFPIELTAPVAPEPAMARRPTGRLIVPIGGGKDSSVVAHILAPLDPLLVSVRANAAAAAIAERLDLRHVVVDRVIDPRLITLNGRGARNGHIPVTAITSAVTAMAASVYGRDTIVMANERSASAPTLRYRGHDVNHQYSKSFRYEQAFAAALAPDYDYFSLLRPWSELAIARAFAAMPHLHDVFMSCNRAFVLDASARSDGWCGRCPKCHFVFLVLAPFLGPDDLVRIFGADWLADASLTTAFRALFLDEARPFECVGEARECAAAVLLLADRAEWRHHAVVHALLPDAERVLGGDVPVDLFTAADEHAVPAAYTALAAPYFAS